MTIDANETTTTARTLGRLGWPVGPIGLDAVESSSLLEAIDPAALPTAAAPPPLLVDAPVEPTVGQRLMTAIAEPLIAMALPSSTWQRQMKDAVQLGLDALGVKRVDLLVLDHVDGEMIKAGQPFNQLMRQRDAGRCRGFGVVAQSIETARWALANAPVHALILPQTVADTAIAEGPGSARRPRLLDGAVEEGVAVLVSLSGATSEAVQRYLAEPAIVSVLLAAVERTPLDVPPPAGGHPPGEG